MNPFKSGIAVLFSLAVVPLANAQSPGEITVTWEAVDAGIPTLATWGVLVMALVLAAVGVRMLKAHGQATRLMSVGLIACGLLMGAQTARSLIITSLPDIEGAECAGGSRTYLVLFEVSLTNACKNPVNIVAYEYPDVVEGCFELQETCPVGTRLSPNGGTCDKVNYYSTDNCDN